MTSARSREELYREITASRSDPSGFYALLGMVLEELGEGRSRFSMPTGPRLFNAGGMVHGGAIASLADASIAAALATLVDPDKEAIATIEIKVNFTAPLRGGEAFAEGRIIQKGKTVAVGESEVRDGEGRLLAKAMATYAVRSRGG